MNGFIALMVSMTILMLVIVSSKFMDTDSFPSTCWNAVAVAVAVVVLVVGVGVGVDTTLTLQFASLVLAFIDVMAIAMGK